MSKQESATVWGENMMQPFSVNHLDDTQFEELCYDLLQELGFKNLKWRKGTGLSSSPADRGRDIECELIREDMDGTSYVEKWHVECKHHTKGVPPEKLQGALTWAGVKRPHTLLIIASNFLSNAAIDFLREFTEQNRPAFRIKIWERKDLEKLTTGKTRLLQKYNVDTSFLYFSSMHPKHLMYIRHTPINSFDRFIEAINLLDEDIRDEAIAIACREINTDSDADEEGLIKFGMDFLIERCQQLMASMSEEFLVRSLLMSVLQTAKDQISEPAIEEQIESIKSSQVFPTEIDYVNDDRLEKIRKQYESVEWVDKVLSKDEYRNLIIENTEHEIQHTKERHEKFTRLYAEICERVIDYLMEEDLF
jgi:hypothetical protein